MVAAKAAIAVAGWMLLQSSTAHAQTGPVFELQPGLAVTDFVSVPEGTASNSAFSLRFATRFPTTRRWLTPVIGAMLFPYGTTQNTARNTDAPTLFAGNIFSVLSANGTSGWLTIELPLVIAHSPGAGSSENPRDYGRDLVAIPTVYVHLGARALREMGAIWSRLNLFAQLEQNLTPSRDLATGKRDWFNPVATIGLSLKTGAVTPD